MICFRKVCSNFSINSSSSSSSIESCVVEMTQYYSILQLMKFIISHPAIDLIYIMHYLIQYYTYIFLECIYVFILFYFKFQSKY